MSDLIATLRAIIRDELTRLRLPEFGTVTKVLARTASGGKENHQVHLKLHGSGVELQHVGVLSSRIGLSVLPQVGDLMLIAFAEGDLNAPVAIGCLHDDTAHPPVAAEHEVVYEPPQDEDPDVRRLHVQLPGGGTVTLRDDRVEVVLGGTSLTIDKDGAVTIEAAGDLRLSARGNVAISADGDATIEARGSVSLKGLLTSVEGQSEARIKAAAIALAGKTDFSPA